jgi:glucosamine 6-phosphate synthetase-like amidotransferase/phosphosugar isomerase protein
VGDRQCDRHAGDAHSRWVISMQAGPRLEGLTKAFTAPIVDLYMLAIYLADLRGTGSSNQRITGEGNVPHP